jgi:hypothetical protein
MNASMPRHANGRGSRRALRGRWGRLGRRRVAAAVGASVAVTLLLSGCSGSSSSGATHSPTPLPTPSWSLSFAPSPGTGLVTSPKAAQLLQQSKVAMAKTKTVHVQGVMNAGRTPMMIDLETADNSARGTIRVGTGTAQAVFVQGALYLKGDAAFWQPFEGGKTSIMAGKWVQVAATTVPAFGQLLKILPVPGWVEAIAPVNTPVAQLPGKALDGADTLGVRRVAAAAAETIYISTGKTAYPVLIVPAQGGGLKLTAWNAKVADIKPPTGQILDATRITLGS